MSRSDRKRNQDPTPEELAAIIAAVEMAWPRSVAVRVEPAQPAKAWRFSGRWWTVDRAPAANRRRP
jgi:hypothetical protein